VSEVEVEKEVVKPCLDDADSISWTTWLINGEEGTQPALLVITPGVRVRRLTSLPRTTVSNAGSEKNLLDIAAMVPTDEQATASPLVQGEEPARARTEILADRPEEDTSYQFKISQKMLTRKDDMMFSSGTLHRRALAHAACVNVTAMISHHTSVLRKADSISLFPERDQSRRRANTIPDDAASLYHKVWTLCVPVALLDATRVAQEREREKESSFAARGETL
jgi:hypothetical protein